MHVGCSIDHMVFKKQHSYHTGEFSVTLHEITCLGKLVFSFIMTMCDTLKNVFAEALKRWKEEKLKPILMGFQNKNKQFFQTS